MDLEIELKIISGKIDRLQFLCQSNVEFMENVGEIFRSWHMGSVQSTGEDILYRMQIFMSVHFLMNELFNRTLQLEASVHEDISYNSNQPARVDKLLKITLNK